MNDVNLQERLTDVLNRIQDHSIQKIDDLHQHHWKLNPSDLKLNLKSKKKQNIFNSGLFSPSYGSSENIIPGKNPGLNFHEQ